MHSVSADFLVAPGGRILREAGLGLTPAGRIAALTGAGAFHFPGAVIIPGLVNTHTHLELTGLENRAPADDFVEWIRQIVVLQAGRSEADYLQAARSGLRQALASGVTTVADTGRSGAAIQAMAELGASGFAYLEVFGPDPAQCEASLAELDRGLSQLRQYETARARLGVSPHAPYSVSGPLYRAAARLARERKLPIAVHVAESEAESALLREGTGGFADLWRRRGIPLPDRAGCTPVAWLDACEVLGSDTLCIHCVRVDEDDIARLVRSGAAIAHCPRSNRRHGHGDAPLGRLLAAGLRVGVGTDSCASVHPVNLLAEARAARALAGLDAGAALDLVTIGAARALGLGADIGSLEPGKWGDCAVVRLPGPLAEEQVLETLLASHPDDVLMTVIGGKVVYRREDR